MYSLATGSFFNSYFFYFNHCEVPMIESGSLEFPLEIEPGDKITCRMTTGKQNQ